ncbi:hypothetical protein CC78DRAFT_468013 [Lojkania enalia]|uniref:Berberine/berberine-like domain-containing protein n=1 Tax=Lojkania enalia TaxID=147567 RepID=A0A9P4N7M6_9PLEO|nr:hypothetical protein CC78DRAFT_468013 [Didymosphaeria enalia]
MYISYWNTSLSIEEVHSHYWLTNYEKLVRTTRVYDPNRIFKGPQLVGSEKVSIINVRVRSEIW